MDGMSDVSACTIPYQFTGPHSPFFCIEEHTLPWRWKVLWVCLGCDAMGPHFINFWYSVNVFLYEPSLANHGLQSFFVVNFWIYFLKPDKSKITFFCLQTEPWPEPRRHGWPAGWAVAVRPTSGEAGLEPQGQETRSQDCLNSEGVWQVYAGFWGGLCE
jgi:hypothetical protein